MNSIISFFTYTATVWVILNPMISLAESPQISIKVTNCLADGPGAPGICAVSNVKRIALEAAFNPMGNTALKRLAETEINPTGTVPANYLVIHAVDDQTGIDMPVKVAISGARESKAKQFINVNLEVLEDSSTRQGKLQTYINQTKAQDLASGTASQAVVDEVTQKNAEILSALQLVYVENRLGRFRLSVEYHSTQSGAWNGTVTSSAVTIDVVNKGSGIDALP